LTLLISRFQNKNRHVAISAFHVDQRVVIHKSRVLPVGLKMLCAGGYIRRPCNVKNSFEMVKCVVFKTVEIPAGIVFYGIVEGKKYAFIGSGVMRHFSPKIIAVF